jgi:hypothetical protein
MLLLIINLWNQGKKIFSQERKKKDNYKNYDKRRNSEEKF